MVVVALLGSFSIYFGAVRPQRGSGPKLSPSDSLHPWDQLAVFQCVCVDLGVPATCLSANVSPFTLAPPDMEGPTASGDVWVRWEVVGGGGGTSIFLSPFLLFLSALVEVVSL